MISRVWPFLWHGRLAHGLRYPASVGRARPTSAKSESLFSRGRADRCALADIGCADARGYTSPRTSRPCHNFFSSIPYFCCNFAHSHICRIIARAAPQKFFLNSLNSALIGFIHGSYSPVVHLMVDAAEQRLRDRLSKTFGGRFGGDHRPGLSAGFFSDL